MSSREDRAEREFRRGQELQARGRDDLAGIRFQRAERGGIDVSARLSNAPTSAGKQKITGADYSQGDADRANLMQQLRDAKASDHGKPIPGTPPALEVPPQRRSEDQQPAKFNQADADDAADSVEGDGGGGGNPAWVPYGAAGDMLYHDGTEWVLLTAPTVTTNDPVLRHNGTAPYWEEPENC